MALRAYPKRPLDLDGSAAPRANGVRANGGGLLLTSTTRRWSPTCAAARSAPPARRSLSTPACASPPPGAASTSSPAPAATCRSTSTAGSASARVPAANLPLRQVLTRRPNGWQTPAVPRMLTAHAAARRRLRPEDHLAAAGDRAVAAEGPHRGQAAPARRHVDRLRLPAGDGSTVTSTRPTSCTCAASPSTGSTASASSATPARPWAWRCRPRKPAPGCSAGRARRRGPDHRQRAFRAGLRPAQAVDRETTTPGPRTPTRC
jgi:hypothetical protein